MFRSFARPYLAATITFAALAAALATAAVLVGVNDNLPGVVLALLAGIALVTALVHHWRSPRRFLTLGAVSLCLVVVLALVGVAMDISVTGHHLPGSVAPVVESAGSALFLMIAFLGVPSILVALTGALAAWLARRRK
jgi:hypothetical protein